MLRPGDIITLAGTHELAAFEDAIADNIAPNRSRAAWAGRVSLLNLIRPKGFNGSIINIKLVAMDDPLARISDAMSRGWTLGKRPSSGRLTGKFGHLVESFFMGFSLLAEATSSGKGVVGQIQNELWYYPIVPMLKGATIHQPAADQYGRALNRLIAVPKLQGVNDIELDAHARRLTLLGLRRELGRSITDQND